MKIITEQGMFIVTRAGRIDGSFLAIPRGSIGQPKEAAMQEQPSKAVQDYLKTIHSLGGDDQLVSPQDIANRLGVRAPSVTGMLKRLSDSGWITYASGSGAQLTSEGVAEARRVIRRHRLVELFLTRVLGLDWSEVDAEAEALEHAISPRLEQAIAEHLGEPVEDPHGHPIPTPNGDLAVRDLRPLCDFRPGDQVRIREAQDDSPERLRRWQTLGLTPGTVVSILTYEELDALFEIQIGKRVVPMGSEGLAGLRGEPVVDNL